MAYDDKMSNNTTINTELHLTLVRMTVVKKSTKNAREGVGKREPPYTVGGNVNWYNHYGEQYGGSLEN